jgi:hypothetical protein
MCLTDWVGGSNDRSGTAFWPLDSSGLGSYLELFRECSGYLWSHRIHPRRLSSSNFAHRGWHYLAVHRDSLKTQFFAALMPEEKN